MSKNDTIRSASFPLLELQKALYRFHGQISTNTADERVVSCLFDEYSSTVVAPDHLITVLASNILNFCFRPVPSYHLRATYELLLCSNLRKNGLISQRQVYNREKKALHSTTFSASYCRLAVASRTLRIFVRSFIVEPSEIILEAMKLLE